MSEACPDHIHTDTYGKVIRYEYDAVGNLTKLIYPDNTAVTYVYDENRNLVRVTDWAGRVTAYTYDENNRVVGVTKPDGSVTATAYDNKQREFSEEIALFFCSGSKTVFRRRSYS